MQKNVLKLCNILAFILTLMVAIGSLNKPLGYLPDSLIYQASLFILCATYLFNYWSIRQGDHKKISTISDVINVGAGAFFLVGISTKSLGGVDGLVVFVLVLLPLLATPFYMRKSA